MNITESDRFALPEGAWRIDATHTNAGFSIRHAMVNTFRSKFDEVGGTLRTDEQGAPTLTGTVQVASLALTDPDFKAHLMSDDFFDAERFPTITFTSKTVDRTDGELTVVGDLTLKGRTHRVEGRGEIHDGAVDLYGNERFGITIEATIDRTAYGLDWNAPLPRGGFALSNKVKLVLDMAFVRSDPS